MITTNSVFLSNIFGVFISLPTLEEMIHFSFLLAFGLTILSFIIYLSRWGLQYSSKKDKLKHAAALSTDTTSFRNIVTIMSIFSAFFFITFSPWFEEFYNYKEITFQGQVREKYISEKHDTTNIKLEKEEVLVSIVIEGTNERMETYTDVFGNYIFKDIKMSRTVKHVHLSCYLEGFKLLRNALDGDTITSRRIALPEKMRTKVENIILLPEDYNGGKIAKDIEY